MEHISVVLNSPTAAGDDFGCATISFKLASGDELGPPLPFPIGPPFTVPLECPLRSVRQVTVRASMASSVVSLDLHRNGNTLRLLRLDSLDNSLTFEAATPDLFAHLVTLDRLSQQVTLHRGSHERLGLELRPEEGYGSFDRIVAVASVVSGSLADTSCDLKAGDRLLKVNSTWLDTQAFDKACDTI